MSDSVDETSVPELLGEIDDAHQTGDMPLLVRIADALRGSVVMHTQYLAPLMLAASYLIKNTKTLNDGMRSYYTAAKFCEPGRLQETYAIDGFVGALKRVSDPELRATKALSGVLNARPASLLEEASLRQFLSAVSSFSTVDAKLSCLQRAIALSPRDHVLRRAATSAYIDAAMETRSPEDHCKALISLLKDVGRATAEGQSVLTALMTASMPLSSGVMRANMLHECALWGKKRGTLERKGCSKFIAEIQSWPDKDAALLRLIDATNDAPSQGRYETVTANAYMSIANALGDDTKRRTAVVNAVESTDSDRQLHRLAQAWLERNKEIEPTRIITQHNVERFFRVSPDLG